MRAASRWFVRFFPAAFRQQFGAAMVEQIEQEYGRARAQDRTAALLFSLATAWDLVRSGIAEHLNPTWRSMRPSLPEDNRVIATLSAWSKDVRRAARSLRRAPGFTAVTVGTLGLAIGVNAGMFSVVDTVLLNPLPFANADRLVHIAATAPGSGLPDEFDPANEFLLEYRDQSKLIEDISTYNSFTSTLRVGDRVERIRMSWPTHTLFSTLGVSPALGRLPVAADEDRVMVISHALWTTWFGSDSSVIGRSFEISGAPRLVIGVMPPEFVFPAEGPLLWISRVIDVRALTVGQFDDEPLVARMKPGVTTEDLARELTALSKRLPERFGGSATYARIIEQHRAVVRPLEEEILGLVARPLWILLGAVGVVLVIACANVANLFAVRAEWRQRELAVRRAIGAGRGQLIQTQMAEAMVVAALAAVVALAIAAATLPVILRAAPADIPRIESAGLNAGTVLFVLAAALLATLACGLIPALRASAPDLTWLRDGARGSTRGRRWGRDGLVVGQTALALVLLIGSSLLVRSAWTLRHVDPGYNTEDVFTFQIAPEGSHLMDGPSYARFNLEFLDRLAALPGVQAVGLVENVPLNESTPLRRIRTAEMGTAEDAGVMLNRTFIAGDYFRTMEIELLQGRPLVRDDHAMTAGNVVISRTAAHLLWPGQDAVGRRLQRQGQGLESWHTVVGVVEDVVQNDFREEAQPLVYFPLVGPEPTSWAISSPGYVVKTTRGASIAPDVRALVRDVAPTAPMYRVFTMAELARDSMVRLTFTMLTLGIVSVLALILGAVGLYGVLSYAVAQRTREIGVRMALGAEARQVRWMVVAEGARLVTIGVAMGVAVALASTRALESLLYGVEALDAASFAVISIAMMVIGLVASYVPARRASRVDPIESLRGE